MTPGVSITPRGEQWNPACVLMWIARLLKQEERFKPSSFSDKGMGAPLLLLMETKSKYWVENQSPPKNAQ
ncbi:hypothetical protein AGIG_G11310 [Arapaima gigas]